MARRSIFDIDAAAPPAGRSSRIPKSAPPTVLQARLGGRPAPTPEQARDALRKVLPALDGIITPPDIVIRSYRAKKTAKKVGELPPLPRLWTPTSVMTYVGEAFGYSYPTILGQSRYRRTVLARHAAYYIAVLVTGSSVSEIARRAGRDHSTLISALKIIERRMAKDDEYRARVQLIAAKFETARPLKETDI